ncbi:MAG: TonB-dependent receptor [Lentimicrobiaceae bacterium]|jgi:TonB-linked SusC/RagA family outer membrane protein
MQKKILKTIALIGVVVFGFSVHVFAQQNITVKGTVYNENNATLPGATISVKGTTIGTTTDLDGKFTLLVPATAKTIVVSFIGMEPQEVPVTSGPIIVNLTTTATALSEVVVIGYGTVRKNQVTTSISSVSQKDLKNLRVTGVDQALQGKLAGVSVTNNSGQPGGGVALRVRGLTSINSNDPLIVIDGVPFTSNTVSSSGYDGLGGGRGQTGNSFLANINPNDIESIDVLKDASAQAIYGSQGANGVIMITTKKGKSPEGKVSYDGYYGTAQITRRLDVMNLRQFAEYQNAVVTNPSTEFMDPSLLGAGTNWQDAIFRTGYTKSHSLSFSSGKDKTSYFASASYFDQSGCIEGSDYKRYTTRFNLDHTVKNWLNFGLSANIVRSIQNVALADNAPSGTIWLACIQNPLIPVTNSDGTWGGGVTVNGVTYAQDNPVADSKSRGNEVIQNNIFGNMYAEIKFLKELTLKNEVSYTLGTRNNTAYQLGVNVGPRILQSTLIDTRNNSYYYALRNYMNYNKNIGKHYIGLTAGHEAQYSYWEQISGKKVDLTNNILDLSAGSTVQTTWELNGGKGDWSMESYFVRGNYIYDNRYSLSVSYRADASSNFGPNNKWGYFPGVSLGWTITNEKFFEPVKKTISYMKIRLGYGGVGNQNLPNGAPNPPYTALVSIWPGPAGFGSINGQATNYLAGIANPDLSWEKVITSNAGIDMSFLKNRIELTLDVYKKTTTKMLLFSTGPTFLGIGSSWNDLKAPIGNIGQMTNKGFDLSITTQNIVKEDFNWTTSLIFSHYANTLDKLLNESSSLTGSVYYAGNNITYTAPGHPLGSFYGLIYDGIIRTQADLDASLPQFGYPKDETHTWLGDVKYKDINGKDANGKLTGTPDGKIDEADMTYIGSPIPKFTFGFTNTLSYKNFDVSLFLQGSYGAKIYNFMKWQLEKMDNNSLNQLTSVLDRYTAENINGSLPRYTTTNSNNSFISDRYVEDGSYMRIQNFTIGYRLPVKIAQRIKMANLRVYLSAQNLYTFTKYSGYDPEIGSYDNGILLMNVDQGHYPNPRTITMGVNVEF